jgi:hypothetical protein
MVSPELVLKVLEDLLPRWHTYVAGRWVLSDGWSVRAEAGGGGPSFLSTWASPCVLCFLRAWWLCPEDECVPRDGATGKLYCLLSYSVSDQTMPLLPQSSSQDSEGRGHRFFFFSLAHNFYYSIVILLINLLLRMICK